MRSPLKFAAIIAAIVSLATLSCAFADEGKPKIIFSVDQGFGNGVVTQNDRVAIARISEALRPLQERYDVYVLLNPIVGDRSRITQTLDGFAKQRIPFILDAITSDAINMGSVTTFDKPYDVRHGLTASVDEMKRWKKLYGKWFAGIRFMEVFGFDFSLRCTRLPDPPDWAKWYAKTFKLPSDDFFQPSLTEPYLRFIKENGMFAEWTDFHLYEFAPWDPPQKEDEEQLATLFRKYPNLVTMCYSNNEPNEESVPKLPYWHKSVTKFIKHGAAGFGLSDQTWMRKDFDNCPVEEIIAWADSAFRRGSRLVQFEPVWYYFRIPSAATELLDYTKDPAWSDRGTPTANFRRLSDYLLQTRSAR